jgi:hypothetical protein
MTERAWARPNVRDGSKTVLKAPKRHFRFAPINGHHQTGPVGPVRVNNGSGPGEWQIRERRRFSRCLPDASLPQLTCGMRWGCGGHYQSTQEVATRW